MLRAGPPLAGTGPARLSGDRRGVLARIFQERDWFWLDEEQGVIMLEERKLSPGWGWIESTWMLLHGNERKSHTISHRLYAGTEQAGFASVSLFGGLEGAIYDQNAQRLVAVAKR